MEIVLFEKGARLLRSGGVAEKRPRYNHNGETMIVFSNDDIVELHRKSPRLHARLILSSLYAER